MLPAGQSLLLLVNCSEYTASAPDLDCRRITNTPSVCTKRSKYPNMPEFLGSRCTALVPVLSLTLCPPRSETFKISMFWHQIPAQVDINTEIWNLIPCWLIVSERVPACFLWSASHWTSPQHCWRPSPRTRRHRRPSLVPGRAERLRTTWLKTTLIRKRGNTLLG